MALFVQKVTSVKQERRAVNRLVELFVHHQLDDALAYLEAGGDLFPRHHFWGYDQLKSFGYSVGCVDYRKENLLNRLGAKFQVGNLQQQIDCLRKSKKFDLIFDPFMEFTFVLALLKVLKLYRKPIVAVAQRSYAPTEKSFLRRIKQQAVRYVYHHGIDLLLFINKNIWEHNSKGLKNPQKNYLNSWGVDFDFFDNYRQQQTVPPTADYIYSTGGTARDFETLIQAFQGIDFNLRITARNDFRDHLQTEVPGNVFIDTSIAPGLRSTGLIRKEYYNALAVVLSLKEIDKFDPCGITVLMEGLSMGKPVITNPNPAYPFNVEKKKVGLFVPYGDVQGWRDAVDYLINNPDEAREMGERGRHLCKHKYNYKLFMEEVNSRIASTFKDN